jgi:xylulokinase
MEREGGFMTGQLLLGIDIGTSSSKGVLTSPDGTIVAQASVPHETSFPRPGFAEHDADTVWWGEFVLLTRMLLGQGFTGADIAAVGVSAIGPCVVPLDTEGRPLRAGILYGIDSRADAEIHELRAMHGADEMAAFNGLTLTSQTMGPKIRWIRQHEPEIFARTAVFQTSQSYIVFRLTGEQTIDRHSASYFAPLFSFATGDWSDRFAEGVVDVERLPRIIESTDVAGTVTEAAARETGLRAGTPVAGGTIDAPAEGISGGVVDPGDMLSMYGSTMFFLQCVRNPTPDPGMWTVSNAIPGSHYIAGSLTSAGLLTQWLRDTIGVPGHEGDDFYAAMIEAVERVPPGADGLVLVPYLAGERAPMYDPLARGIVAGLSLRHQRGHLFRAALEGTGYGMRHNLEAMRAMGADPKRIVAVGGGTKNPAWMQIVTDITGVPQQVPERTIGASYGDAFIAGLASGVVPDLSELRRTWVRIARTYEPNPDLGTIYDEGFAIFRNLYEATKDDVHVLARAQTG